MGVQLSQDEIDEYLTNGHTLILGTIRQAGEPFLTPLWYVYVDGAVCFRTLGRSAKVKHMRRDPRVCAMVETGDKWVDLQAVVMNCDAEEVDDPLASRIQNALDEKYVEFRFDRSQTPKATQNHYATQHAYFRLNPREGEVRSWYNRKIRGLEHV